MGTDEDDNSSASSGIAAMVAVVVAVALLVVFFRMFRSAARARRREEERRRRAFATSGLHAALAALRLQAPPPSQAYIRQRTASSAAAPGARQPQASAPAVVDLEAPAEPLVCTYSRADGWQEATCPVCLSDMEEGETVWVLPACMHYFHDACVGEWLRGHNTCPLCRAAPAAEDGSAAAG